MSRTMYGFEQRIHVGGYDDDDRHECTYRCNTWSAEACGHQGPDNYFETEQEALDELPNLAARLSERDHEVDVRDLRVVAVEVP